MSPAIFAYVVNARNVRVLLWMILCLWYVGYRTDGDGDVGAMCSIGLRACGQAIPLIQFYVRNIMRNITSVVGVAHRRIVGDGQEPAVFGAMELEALAVVVRESIKAFSITTHLSQNEAVRILGEINVATLDEVQAAVGNLDGIEGMDAMRITVAVEETIKAVAAATHLEPDEIFGVLAEKSGATLEDMVGRLHERSRGVRAYHA